MKTLILLFFILNLAIAQEKLTSEALFGDMTIENIEKNNPLKDKNIYFDKNKTEYKFIDEDNDKAEDRLEKYLNGNKEYNELSKLYMFQRLFLLHKYKTECSSNFEIKKCVKLYESKVQWKLHYVCKKEFKKNLIFHGVYRDILGSNTSSKIIKDINYRTIKLVSSSGIDREDVIVLLLPNLKCEKETFL